MRTYWGLNLLLGVVALTGLTLLLATLLVDHSSPQEAAGQEPTQPATSAPTESTPAPEAPPELTQEFFSEDEPEGIPGLSVLDVIGNLKHFRTESRFVCDGPHPTDGRGSIWTCWAPGQESPSTYKVTVVGANPLTIFSVVATVRGASDKQAAEFFTYVASLCLQGADPLNPKAWVEQNVSAGGQVFTEGAELTIYGTKEERTLQVVATGLATTD